MSRKNIPLVLMLFAGAITCIITFFQEYTINQKLLALFLVLLIFYFLGNVLKWTLDRFDAQNEKKNQENGEVVEKGSEETENTEDTEKEN